MGFQLKEIYAPLTKVARQYSDQVARTPIIGKSEFIELLTHDCYVVQVPRIGSKVQSRVEKLLSFFEQNYFIDEDGMIKEYHHVVEDGAMQLIANTLHFIGTDPERRSWLATEREAYRTYYVELEGIEKELEESQQVIAEMKLEVDQERKARIEKEQENERLLRELAELKKRLNG